MNTALQTVESDQQGDRYVKSTEILRLLEESKKAGKIFVLNSDCGTGKTQAILDAVSRSFEQGWLLIIEKIATGERMREALIKRGVPKADIEVYHHRNEQRLKEIYNRQSSKAVSIITHKRLELDPLHYFLSSNSDIYSEKSYVIVDEKPPLSFKDEVNSVLLLSSLKVLLTHPPAYKESESNLPFLLERALKDKCFLAAPEVKTLIADYRAHLDAYTEAVIKHATDIEEARRKGRLSNKKSVTDTISDIIGLKFNTQEAIKEGKEAKKKLSQKYPDPAKSNPAKFRARLGYKISLNIEAILTGRMIPLSSDVLEWPLLATVPTPLLDWKHGTLILDGSADLSEFHSYPTDCIEVVSIEAKLKPVKVKVIIVPSPVSKYEAKKDSTSKQSYACYLNSLLRTALSECIGPIYYTGYKEKADELEENTMLSDTQEDSPHQNSENIYYQHKQEKSVTIVDPEDSFFSTRKISDLLSSTFTIPKNQLSLLTPEALDNPSRLESLHKNHKFILSYYGLMKGSNAFTEVTNFVSQGFFIFPIDVYETMEKNKIVNDREGIAAEELYQELMRTGIRAGKDVTLILSDDMIQKDTNNLGEYKVSKPIQLVIDKLRKNHKVNVIHKSLGDTYELAVRPGIKLIIEQFQKNSLRHWKSPKDLLVRLIARYPAILTQPWIVEVNLQEFAKTFDKPPRSDHLLERMRNMESKSSGYLQMEVINQATNQNKFTEIRFRINGNLICQQ